MPLKFAVLTVSDRSFRGQRADLSGPAVVEHLIQAGHMVLEQGLVPDELDEIAAVLERWCAAGHFDIVLTTGGTGFAPRDVTPEATLRVAQRRAPGLAEAMRSASLQVTPHAMLSRAEAAICDRTLILNLPGSPKAALENLQVVLPVLPHAIELLHENPSAESGHQLSLEES